MKKYICALLPVLIALFGCTDPVQDVSKTDSGAIAPGMGRVIIGQVEPQERTLLPQTPVFVSYLLSFQYQGEGNASKNNQTVASLPCTVDLSPGPWLITVTAYTRIEGVQGLADGNYPAASGSATVTASSGAIVPATVNLQSGTEMEGRGVLEYHIELPAERTSVAALRILKINKSELTSINLLEAASGSIVIDAGYYLLQAQIATGRTRTKTELIHIYSGHTTRAAGSAWDFNAEEGVYFSITELSDFLASMPANTKTTPYAVALNVSNPGGTSDAVGSLGRMLKNNPTKYVNLNLSGSTFINIGNNTFDGCTSLAGVTIPNSVTSIGDKAFYGCTGLDGITIPNSVTSIEELSFSGCINLRNIAIGSDKISLSRNRNWGTIFSATNLAVTFLDNITNIGNFAFYYCTRLTSVTIGNNVTSIGGEAFSYCINLTAIDVDAANTTYSSIDGVLYNKGKTTLVKYPNGKAVDFTIPNSVTSIGDWAFDLCTSLTSITIPDSITSIGDWAFKACESLTSVTIPDSVTSIGNYAFGECVGLTSVTIGNNVTSTGAVAFSHCWSLTSVTIGNSVTSIGNRAFEDCTSLTSIIIPNGVTNIGESAFSDCTGLTSVTIPDSVTSIGFDAFGNCTSLNSVTFQGGAISSFSNYAFYGLGDLRDKFFAIDQINGTPGTYTRDNGGSVWTKQ